MSLVDRVLGRGAAKTSVVTRRGTQVDLRVVAAHQLGAALLYFTGSKGHNIKLRMRALARGLTLNEYALSEIEGGQASSPARPRSRSTRRSACRSSRRCCARTRGEIEAAEKRHAAAPDRPPSSATSTCTPRSRATAARRWRRWWPRRKARGYRVLAITDHAEGTLSGVGREALLEQRARIRAHAGRAGRLAARCSTAWS